MMGIEKKAALVCVAVLALLFGIGLANRDHRPANETAKAAFGTTDSSRSGAILPDVKVIESGRPEVGVIKPKEPKVETREVDAGYREVVVLARDNFWKIAKRELGDAALHRAVSRANPGLDPKKLQVGQKILVPIDPQSQIAVTDRQAAGPRAEEVGSPREYRVRKGESLSRIAIKVYGKEARWRDIWAANRAALPDPAKIRPGMRIVLP